MFDGQSDVHWKNKLLEIGGIDLFKGTALEELAATRQCPSWLIEIPECLVSFAWSTVAGSSCDLLQSALKLGHHRHSSDDTHTLGIAAFMQVSFRARVRIGSLAGALRRT